MVLQLRWPFFILWILLLNLGTLAKSFQSLRFILGESEIRSEARQGLRRLLCHCRIHAFYLLSYLHFSDTRMLLCPVSDGSAIPLTNVSVNRASPLSLPRLAPDCFRSLISGNSLSLSFEQYHHPDDRSESERLRKMGAGMITDSFGEARWMGALANTRAFGDSKYK